MDSQAGPSLAAQRELTAPILWEVSRWADGWARLTLVGPNQTVAIVLEPAAQIELARVLLGE